MKHTKMMAFAAAFIMLAVGFMVFAGSMSDADDDPVQVNDETVNIYFDGSGSWTSGEYEKFNVFEAIQAACGMSNQKLAIRTLTGNDDWTQTSAENGTYPNPNYGTISEVGYMYIDDDELVIDYTTSFSIYGRNYGDSDWVDITPYALGWIRPFTDYRLHSELVYNNNVISWASAFANIAIKMRSSSSLADITATGTTLLPLKSLTDPSTRTDCTYTFILKDVCGLLPTYMPSGATFYGRTGGADSNAVQLDLTQLENGGSITVYGYGSDAYLALHHALNGAVVAQEETYIYNSQQQYYTNYSWMTHMFGVGTVSTPVPEPGTGTIYDYWATYKAASDGTPGEYASFNLGYHTNVPGSYSHAFSPTYTYDCTGHSYVIQYERSYPPTS